MVGMTASVAERRAALEASLPDWPSLTYPTLLRRNVELYGDRPVVLTDRRSLTYRELWAEARTLAKGLVAIGVEPGDHVAMVMANHAEFVVLQFAVACAGAVNVPFNFRLQREELGHVIGQSKATCLITMDAFGDHDYLDLLDRIAPGWESRPESTFPDLRQVITFSAERTGPARAGVLDLDGLAERGREVDDAEIDRRIEAGRATDVICLMYTSGTTGFSKGAMLTHDNFLRCAFASARIRALEDGRRILFALPLYHVFAYAEGLTAAFWVGGAIVPRLVFDPEDTFTAIERFRAQEALFVPTMALVLVEHPARKDHDLSSLNAVMTASAPAPVRLWEQVKAELGVEEVVTAYGQTEVTAATTYTMPDDPLELASVTVGRPKEGGVAGDPALGGMVCVYKTIDPVTLEDLPAGAEGELAVAGPQLMRGYFDKPEETEKVFLPGRWMRSGDLGEVRPDGYLRLTGRSKELYKRGAELVAPKEVEILLDGRPDVLQSYVVGVPDELWGEVGWAFVVPAAGRHPTEAELLADCREHLARFKVPEHVEFITGQELPLTGSGKVQKFKLAERVAERRRRETATP